MDHVAIDLGGRESQICVRDASGAIRLERRVSTPGLPAVLKKMAPSRVILETCGEAFAVAVVAREAGHDVRVVAATLARALGVGARGIKTDTRDARNLSEASVRMDLRSVHIPAKVSRDIKTACGMREVAVGSRTGLVNNVRGWLRTELVRVRSGAVETFPDRVREAFGSPERPLPACVARQLEVIAELTKQIGEADKELLALARKNAECLRLMSVPGVGPNTALRFFAAIDSCGAPRYVE